MEKFLKGIVKLPTPVETGALISAIQFFRYEDRLSGKKLQSHNLAQKAAASLLASQPQSQSHAVLCPSVLPTHGFWVFVVAMSMVYSPPPSLDPPPSPPPPPPPNTPF